MVGGLTQSVTYGTTDEQILSLHASIRVLPIEITKLMMVVPIISRARIKLWDQWMEMFRREHIS